MHTTYNSHAANSIKNETVSQLSPWNRFIKWADGQESSRMLWTAVSIVGHGCFFTIITMSAILLTGNNFIFWPFAIASMTMCVVVNLAAMPAKVIIPVFFFSLLIDVVIIVLCLAQGFQLEAMYR